MVKLISGDEDMAWLLSGHLHSFTQLSIETYKSACIEGNEDCPSRIDLYLSANPKMSDVPQSFFYEEKSGDYVRGSTIRDTLMHEAHLDKLLNALDNSRTKG